MQFVTLFDSQTSTSRRRETGNKKRETGNGKGETGNGKLWFAKKNGHKKDGNREKMLREKMLRMGVKIIDFKRHGALKS